MIIIHTKAYDSRNHAVQIGFSAIKSDTKRCQLQIELMNNRRFVCGRQMLKAMLVVFSCNYMSFVHTLASRRRLCGANAFNPSHRNELKDIC